MTLAFPAVVSAGGWAVIILDHLPDQLTAGEPYKIGFMARQHGLTAWVVDEMRIEARHLDSGNTAQFIARPDNRRGHYRAELLFNEPGRWQWGIESGLHPILQPMPDLTVGETTAVRGTLAGPGRLLGGSALLALVMGIALIIRGPKMMALRLTGGGLIVVCAGLMFAFFSSANAQARQIPPAPADSEIGRQLFLAKGCVVCHTNTRVLEDPEEVVVEVGPNLTVYRNDPEYLRAFLADPAKMRPAAENVLPMPDLGLKPDEIDALVSFLNRPAPE